MIKTIKQYVSLLKKHWNKDGVKGGLLMTLVPPVLWCVAPLALKLFGGDVSGLGLLLLPVIGLGYLAVFLIIDLANLKRIDKESVVVSSDRK